LDMHLTHLEALALIQGTPKDASSSIPFKLVRMGKHHVKKSQK